MHLHRVGLRRETLGVDVVRSCKAKWFSIFSLILVVVVFFFQSDVKRFSLFTDYPETVQPFRNDLVLLPPPTLSTTETGKKILETCVQRCLCGEGRGRSRVCVNWKTPQKFKSIPTFVHDCSLPSSSLLCTVLVSRISESEP